MTDNSSETAASQPTEPILCKMGCGFFGNQTTGGCCSKCWGSIQKDKATDSGSVGTSATEASRSESPMEADVMSVDVKPTPMEADEETPAASSPVENPPPAAAATTTKKKKKKKQSYKNMMASMMNSNGESRDSEKEKNELRKVTGGGAFSKIDKI